MLRPCWSRTAAATSRGRCWARPSRRCINQLVTSILDAARAELLAARCCDLLEGGFSAAAYGRTQKRKGPTFVGPVSGGKPRAIDPIPTAPGGWGLRNPEPKGPGQRRISYLKWARRAVGGSGAEI